MCGRKLIWKFLRKWWNKSQTCSRRTKTTTQVRMLRLGRSLRILYVYIKCSSDECNSFFERLVCITILRHHRQYRATFFKSNAPLLPLQPFPCADLNFKIMRRLYNWSPKLRICPVWLWPASNRLRIEPRNEYGGHCKNLCSIEMTSRI